MRRRYKFGCRGAIIGLGLLTMLIFAEQAGAVIMTFENLWTGNPGEMVRLSDYGGVTWTNAGSYNKNPASSTELTLGTLGQVSMFNWQGLNASMSSSTPFNFNGAYITREYPEQYVKLEGWLGGDLKYDYTLPIGGISPTWYTCNFRGVDTVWFKSSGPGGGGAIIVVDNIYINTARVPTAVIVGMLLDSD
jgi:hypothetical protein